MPTLPGHRRVAVALLATLVVTVAAAHGHPVVGPAYVTRVVDSDTFYAELGGRLEVVRYLGINTPWIEHPALGTERYTDAAREANRRLVEGKWVRLVFDGAPRDRHGRLLAYVWTGDVFVNAMLVHLGYAEAAAASSASHAAYFVMLQDGAQRDARGLWREASALAYHRPRPTEAVADEQRGPGVTDGRVFSAPAPFVPASTPSSRPSGGTSPGIGSPSYLVPQGALRQ
jgi:micrococcal nuclease